MLGDDLCEFLREGVTGMNISQAGIDLIKHFEDLQLTAYQDAVGVWTIGYGHTENVYQGQVLSKSEAEEFLQADMRKFELAVMKALQRAVVQSQFDALVSFTYNLGTGALMNSTLLKKINAGDDASNEFLKWVLAGGRALPGLVLRRMAERLMFQGKDWRVVL